MPSIEEMLKSVPQYEHFTEDGISMFRNRYGNDKRLAWHVARLCGIGGSETGVAVAARRGVDDLFAKEPTDLALEKLLRIPPIPETGAMKFGQFAENSLREMFLEEYGAKRDFASLEAFNSMKGPEKHPWMRYSPDDVILINGRRILTDYKVPGEGHAANHLPLRYVAQLHQGAMLMDYHGIKVDGMMLVQFPLDQREMLVSDVSFDESIVMDILEGNDELWFGYILEGKIPARADIKIEPDALANSEEFARACAGFARYKTIGDLAYERASEFKREIQEISASALSGKLDIGLSGKVAVSGVKYSFNMVFDADKSADMLDEAEAAECRKPAGLNSAAMAERLRELGEDLSKFAAGDGIMEWDEARLAQALEARSIPWKTFASSVSHRIAIDKKHDLVLAAKSLGAEHIDLIGARLGAGAHRAEDDADLMDDLPGLSA